MKIRLLIFKYLNKFLFKYFFITMKAAAAAALGSVVSDSVRPHRQQPTRFPRPWDSPGKNTGVSSVFINSDSFLSSNYMVTLFVLPFATVL